MLKRSFLNRFSSWFPGALCLLVLLLQGSVQAGVADTAAANEIYQRGLSARSNGDYEKSAADLSQAGNIYAAFLKDGDDVKIRERYLHSQNLLGSNWRILGEIKRSERILQDALHYGQTHFSAEHPGIARSHHQLGSLYYVWGDETRSLQHYNKALEIRRKTLGENHPHVGAVYHNIGLIYDEQGDYNRALSYYTQSLNIDRQAKGETHSDIAASYHNIGSVYQQKKQYDTALEYYQKAIRIWEAVLPAEHPHIAMSYHNIGVAYQVKGDVPIALKFHEKALGLLQVNLGEMHLETANVYGSLGDDYMALDDPPRAMNYYRKALGIYQSILGANHPSVALTYEKIGEIHAALQQYMAALGYYQKALVILVDDFDDNTISSNPSLEEIKNDYSVVRALTLKARALREQAFQTTAADGKSWLNQSLETYRLLSRLIDRIRTGYKEKDSKLFLTNESADIYEEAVLTAFYLHGISGNKDYLAAGFEFAEKNRAAVLLAAMQEVRARQFSGIPDSLLVQERSLKNALSFYDRQIAEGADSTRLAEWQQEMFRLNGEYRSFIGALERNYPDYHRLKYGVNNAGIADVQESLSGNEMLLEYVVSDKDIFIFIISATDADWIKLEKPPLLAQRVRQMQFGLTTNDYFIYTRYARQLYEALLAPIAAQIAGKSLIIVPDNILYLIPFEALLSEDVSRERRDFTTLPYFDRTHQIRYSYSATIFSTPSWQAPAETNFIGYAPFAREIGNPLITSADLFADIAPARKSMSPLPDSKREIRQIHELFNANRFSADAFFEKEANELHLKNEQLANYRYVHLATHATVDAASPQLSAIYLAGEDNREEDGALYAGEIYQLHLNADLVVLSACETGSGQVLRGEGIVGMTRGFFYAGAKNVLVSLWPVNDTSTSHLMVEFYREMLASKPKASALQQAKKNLRENKRFSSPFYWSPFVLIGR